MNHPYVVEHILKNVLTPKLRSAFQVDMYFLYKGCWENDSPLAQGEQQEVPPSVSRSPPSVDIYLPNLPVGN